MILRFRVYEQTISAIASISEPRQGSAEYLQLRITFGKDWENLDRTLWFLDDAGVTEPVSLGQDKNEFVDVPSYFTAQESFRITLTGMKADQFVPTNEIIISLAESNELCESEAPELQPSWVVQYLDLYQHPPIPSDRGFWQLWNPKTQQYELSDIPLPSVTGGSAGTVEIASVVALRYGETPTVTETEDSTPQARKYVLGIPAGPKGEAGVSVFAAHVTAGDAPTIEVHRDEIEQRYDKPGIDDLLLTDDAKIYIVTGLGKDSSNIVSYYFAKYSSSIRGPAGPAGSGSSLTIESDGVGNVTIAASGGASITSDGAGNVTIA